MMERSRSAVLWIFVAWALLSQAQPSATIVLEANDRMEFVPATLHLEAGASVTLEFRNVSRLPNFFHNFVLLKAGTNVAQFGNAALNAKDTDYIPPTLADSVIAHTPLTKPGEIVRIEFVAPAKGEYDFICSYPGRYTVMKGKLIVHEPK